MSNQLKILLKAVDYSGSGSWLDQSGNGKNATLENGSISKNSAGNGIVLNGSTSWTFPNLSLGNAWTIETWYKDNGTPESQNQACIVTQRYQSSSINAYLGFVSNGTISAGFYNPSDSFHATPYISLDLVWTHYAITWNGSNLLFYKNSILQNTTARSAVANDSGQPYYIGRQWGINIYMVGEIGELRIYNYAITQSQVTTDYNESYSTFFGPFKVILLKAINYSGSGSWLDQSGNNRNATLENGQISKNSVGNGIVLNGSTSWTFSNVAVGNAWSANVWVKNTSNSQPTYSSYLTQIQNGGSVNLMIGNWNGIITPSFNVGYSNWYNSPNTIALVLNTWTNIQVTWDGTSMKTYVNSNLLGTYVPGSQSIDNNTAYRIGRRWDNADYMVGEIGEVCIYNGAISQTQVTADYNSSLSTFISEDPPTPITNLTASNIETSSFNISWSGGNNATSYTYSITPTINNGVSNKTAYFTNLTDNTTYSIIVTAINSGGNAVSSPLSVTTLTKIQLLLLKGVDYSGSGPWLDESGNDNDATSSSTITKNTAGNAIVLSSPNTLSVPNLGINNSWSVGLSYKSNNVPSIILIGGSYGYIYSSIDGVNWDKSNSNVTSVYSIVSNGSYWLAGGTTGISKSIDGISWTKIYTTSTEVKTLAWSSEGSYWVGGLSGSSPNLGYYIKSSDGINWIQTLSTMDSINIIVWNGSYWLAGGDCSSTGNSTVNISSDGITWTPAVDAPFPSYSGSGCEGAVWNGSFWIGVGNSVIGKSFNGLNWTIIPQNNGYLSGSGVAWNGSQYIALNGSSFYLQFPYSILVSSDGINWVTSTNNPFPGNSWNGAYTVTWIPFKNYWIVAGRTTTNYGDPFAAQSYDGMNWSPISIQAQGPWESGLSSAVSPTSNNTDNSNGTIFSQIQQNNNSVVKIGHVGSNNVEYIAGFINNNTYYNNGSFSLNSGIFYNIYVTWDGTTLKTYINGSQSYTYIPGYPSIDSGSTYVIGGGVNGELLDLTVYNYPVSQNQITSAYQSFTDLFKPTPITNIVTVAYSTSFDVSWSGGVNSISYTYTLNNNSTTPSTSTNQTATFINLIPETEYTLLITATNTYGSVNGTTIVSTIPPVCKLSLKAIDYSGTGSWLDQSDYNNDATLLTGTITKNTTGNGIILDGSTAWTFPNIGVSNAWGVSVWYKPTIKYAKFIIGGTDGTMAYGIDGLNWTTMSNPFSGSNSAVRSVVYNNNYWIASGQNSNSTVTIAKSTDGIDWIPSNINPFITGGCQRVAWSPEGSYWIGVGYTNPQSITIAKSTNGVTWVDSVSAGGNNPFVGGYGQNIAYNGSYWIAVGNNAALTVAIAKSTDGINWTPSTNQPFQYGNAIGWSPEGSYWIAGGNGSSEFAKSTDGMTWTLSYTTVFQQTYDVAWSPKGSYWIAAGTGGNNNAYCVLRSSDGITWTDSVAAGGNNPFQGHGSFGLLWTGSYWIIGAGGVGIAKSTDGINWTVANTNPFGSGYGIRTGASAYITNSSIISQNSSNSAIYIGNDNSIFSSGFVNSQFYGNTFSIDSKRWYNIQTMWDGTTLKIYKNSVLISTSEPGGTAINTNQNYLIGKNPVSNNFITGEIGEIKIYNYEIPQSTVNSDYLASAPTYQQLLLSLKASNYSGSGTWNDESGLEYNATLETGTISKNSAGNGIILDGSTSWTFPNVQLGNAWTANVWYKNTSAGISTINTSALILTQLPSSGNSNLILGDIDGNNTVVAGFINDNTYNQSQDISSCFRTKAWINTIITWDGTTLSTYINSKLINTITPGQPSIDSNEIYRIGCSYDGSSYVDGEIGEIKIYNYALNQSQVTTDYNSSFTTYYNINFVFPSVQLILSYNAIDSSLFPTSITTNGNVKPKIVDNKQGHYFNNNLSNYLSLPYTNPTQVTFSFWMYVIDDNFYNPMSLTNLTFQGPDIIFNPSIGSPSDNISIYAALPTQWSNANYPFNYVGQWIHTTWTIDNTNYTATLYVNGQLATSVTGTGPMPNAPSIVLGRSGDNSRAFNGYIAQFCVYNNLILSPAQILYNYNTIKPVLAQLLVLLKAIDYSGSGLWNDDTDNNNNATIVDGTPSKNTEDNGIILNSSQYWTLPNLSVGFNWSASVWFKLTNSETTGSFPFIIRQIPSSGTYNLVVGQPNGTNIFYNAFYGLQNVYNYTLNIGYWYNIQSTWDGTTFNTYINSKLVNTNVTSGLSSEDNGLEYIIGSLNGEIGEIKIYNYAITPTQVSNNYTDSYIVFNKNYPTIFVPDTKYAIAWVGAICDSIGNIYSINPTTNKLYKINPSGYGIIFADFTPYVNVFSSITIDSNNNLYVSCADKIYKVDTSGNIFLWAQFGSNLVSMSFDSSGNMYAADALASGVVYYITADGSTVTTVLSSLAYPVITFGNNLLYIGSFNSGNIRVSDPANSYTITTLTTGLNVVGLQIDKNNNLLGYTQDAKLYLITSDIGTKILLLSGTSLGLAGGVAVDYLNNYYLPNTNNGVITKINQLYPGIITDSYTGPGSVNLISCITDRLGNLYTLYNNGSFYQNDALIISFGNYNKYNSGMTVDLDNNIYVVINSTIFKIIYNDWTYNSYYSRNNANFKGLTWTTSGLYIVDSIANKLYLLDNNLNISTIKTGLNTPYDVKVGPNGNFYIANYGSGTISVINKTTLVTTTFASGFTHPYGLVFDQHKNLFVSDNVGYLYVIDPDSNITTIASGLSNPQWITQYNETIYVGNFGNNTISTFSNYTSIIPVPSSFYINPIGFGSTGITSIDQMTIAPNGDIYVYANASPNGLYKIDRNKNVSLVSSFTTTSGFCSDILGNIYVSFDNNIYIFNISTGGNYNTFATDFTNVSDICITSDMSTLYVSDIDIPCIYKLTNNGSVKTSIYTIIAHRIAVDSNNYLYAITNSQQVLKINPTNYTSTIIGSNIVYNNLNSIKCDSNNNVYILDLQDNTIYKIDSSGFASIVVSNQPGETVSLGCDLNNNIYINYGISGNIVQLPNIVPKTNKQVLLLQATNYESGIWLDQSGNNNHAILLSGTAKINELGNGLVLDGSTSWTFPDPNLGNAWSMGIWYKDTGSDLGLNPQIVTQRWNNHVASGYIGWYNSNVHGGIISNGTDINTLNPISLTQNVWINIYITWDGTNMLTYVNGQLLGSTAFTGGISSSSGLSFLIGQRFDSNNYVIGEIGEVRMYNYQITSTQILNNYTSTYINYNKYPFTLLVDQKVVFNNFSFTISAEQNGGSTIPLTIPGLQAWYDGADLSSIISTNGNNVSQWNDKSGNNYNTTGIYGQPILNSSGGIDFDGGSSFSLPDGTIPYGDSSYSIYFVATFFGTAPRSILGGGSANPNNALFIAGSSNNTVLTSWQSNDIYTNITYNNNTPVLFNTLYQSGGQRNVYLYGTNNGSDTPGSRNQYNTDNYIGSNFYGQTMDGTINEILVFNINHTQVQRQLIEGYLSWKWNTVNSLPWMHPYKFTQPSIVPANPINPKTINSSNLVSWYDFYDSNSVCINSSNKVSAVFDKNYNNDLKIVSSNLPTLEAGNGLILDGTMYFESKNFVQNLDTFTIYLVFEQKTQTSNAGILSFTSTTGGWDTNVNAMSVNTGSGIDNLNFNVATGNLQLSPTNTDTTTNLYTITSSSATNTLNIYYNGVLNGSINTPTIATNGTSSGFILGSRYINYANTNGLVGILKEVIIYNNCADTSSRQELEGYLSWKWDIENKLTNTNPYYNLPPGTSTQVLDPNTIKFSNPCNLWLDGSDTKSITGLNWNDKSGNKITETYSGSAININTDIIPGMNSVQFIGDGNYFTGNLKIIYNAISISFVVNVDPSCAAGARILSFYTSTEDDSGYSNTFNIYYYGSGYISMNNNVQTTGFIPIYPGSFNLITYIMDPISGNIYGYLNGQLYSQDNINFNINTTLLAVGANTFWGYINEVVFYPYALRNDDRQVLEGYLAWKWQLQTLLYGDSPYLSYPPITTISSFQPNQITNLDVWNDANDLIKYGYKNGDVILNWNNRANTKWYGNNDGTLPVFTRFGLNGLPTITYGGNYTIIQDPLENNYSAYNPTFMAISRWTGGWNAPIFTDNNNNTQIGYSPGGYKNTLTINGDPIVPEGSPVTVGGDTNWDNYSLTGNLDGTISWSNYNVNLLTDQNRPTSGVALNGLAYTYNYQSYAEISEVLVYSQPLPSFYLQKLQGYLCWKWGLQTNLPLTHPYRYQPPSAEENLFTLSLKGWTSEMNIQVLYLFDTPSQTLLTTIPSIYGNNTIGYFATFAYQFKQSQNYLTISNSPIMNSGFIYNIPTPLIVTPKLTLNLVPTDPINNWGYLNTSKTFSFNLTSYHLGNLVNFTNYYSILRVYYADNTSFNNLTFIGNATITNINGSNQISFLFNNTVNLPAIYFYFTYSSSPSVLDTFISGVYAFIDKNDLSITLNRYTYLMGLDVYTNFPSIINFSGINSLYVYYSKNDPTYSEQNYLTYVNMNDATSGSFNATFPLPDVGNYYLTISNKGQGVTRNANDLNVNIELPINVYPVNVLLNTYILTLTATNTYNGTIGPTNGNPYSAENIRIFYSTVIATQNSDLTELTGSPFGVSGNAFSFNFNNSVLLLNNLYFYFTDNTNPTPALSSFGHSPLVSTSNLLLSLEKPINYTFNLNHNISNTELYRLNNHPITLNISDTTYKEIYLFTSPDQKSKKTPIINPITGTNKYKTSKITFTTNINQIHNTISYFYGSTEQNYDESTCLGISLPYVYLDNNKFKLSLDHYTNKSNIYNITITNYHSVLLGVPLYVLAKDSNNKYINLHQTLTLDQLFKGKCKYSFPENNVYTLVVTDSFNKQNIPDGKIIIESSPIYTFTLNTKLNKTISYLGSNSYILTVNNHLNIIKSGNLFINNVAHPKNPFTIKNNQINFTLNKDSNSNDEVTFKTIDNSISLSSTIIHKNMEAIIDKDNIIKLNNWNPITSSVKLYQNEIYLNNFSVVYNKEYYIIVNIELSSLDNLTIQDGTNTYPVTNPNKLQLKHDITNIIVSPSSSEINKSTTFYFKSNNKYIYSAHTLNHSGKIGSGANDLTYFGIQEDLDKKIIITTNKLPIYIITSSIQIKPTYTNESRVYEYSNIITESSITKTININGKFDEINTFTIDLSSNYSNIEVNDTKNIIKSTINNNKVIFSYDPGYDESGTFNIINGVSKEIYEIINVKYI